MARVDFELRMALAKVSRTSGLLTRGALRTSGAPFALFFAALCLVSSGAFAQETPGPKVTPKATAPAPPKIEIVPKEKKPPTAKPKEASKTKPKAKPAQATKTPGKKVPEKKVPEKKIQRSVTKTGAKVEIRTKDDPKKGKKGEDGTAKPDASATKKNSSRFVEGELANVGASGLIPWENRFGLSFGIERLGEIFYVAVQTEINYSTTLAGRDLSMSFGVPMRIQLLDARPDRRWDDAGQIRKRDWDEVSDYATVIRRIQYGGKEQHIYLDVNAFTANSIGHGALLRRYNSHLNLNTRRVSAQFDAFSDFGGVETYINDITGPNILGGLVFLKPLSLVDRSQYFLRSFSIGFSMVADIDAPLRNRLDEDDVDNDGRRFNEILVDQGTFQPIYSPTTVLAYGVDVEFKVIDRRALDWKMYFDYSFLESGVPIDDPSSPSYENIPSRGVRSSGLTIGHLFRQNLGVNPVHALRFRLEYLRYDPNYVPGYFDTLYEIQRIQYLAKTSGQTSDLANQTKVQQVLGRDPSGSAVNGLYFEASWRIGNGFALSLGVALNSAGADDSLYVHIESPEFETLQFFATYQRRNASGFKDLFAFDFRETDLFMLKARYRLLDVLHLNMEALTPFGIGPESLFRSTVQVNVNAEFGFAY